MNSPYCECRLRLNGSESVAEPVDGTYYALYFFVSEAAVSTGWDEGDVGSRSKGGGGVVAVVYPIHAAITKIPATARKAVACRVIRGQPYTNQAYRMIPRMLSARIAAPHA